MIEVRLMGNKQLIQKVDRLIKKLDREPTNTIQSMADSAYLFAMAQAPKRTGALASNIKRAGGRNWASLSLGPVSSSRHPNYPMWIDMDVVGNKWGTKKSRGMVDMRDRNEKIGFFVGTEGNPGHTLRFAWENFPGHVSRLANKLDLR